MKSKYFIYTTALGHLSTDTAQGSLPALLPLFISTYGLNYQEAAGLMFANTAFASVLQPLFGYLADKHSMPWLVPLGVLFTGCGIAIMGFVDSYNALFLAALLAGIGSALFHPEAARIINRHSGAEKGKNMGTFAVGGNGGFALGPILAGLAYWQNQHWLLIYLFINTTMACIITFILSKEKKSTPVPNTNTNTTQKATTELPINDWKNFGRLSVVILTRAINFAVLNTFIPIYWIHVLNQSTNAANLALTIFFSIGVLVTFFGGILADKIGYVKVIRLSYIILVPIMFLFTNSSNYWFSLLLLLPLGFGVFAQYSPIVVLGQSYLARSVGFSAGITLGVGITLGGIFSPFVGWLADNYGLAMALQVLNIVTICGLIFSYFIKDIAKTKKA